MNDEPKTSHEAEPEEPKVDTVSKDLYDRVNADLAAALELAQEEKDAKDAALKRVKDLEPLEAKVKELEDGLTGSEAKARALEAARAYDRLADELGVKPEFRDDVLKLADFKPEGEFDEKALRGHLEGFLKERPQYTTAGSPPPKLPKGEGAGRGGDSPGFGDGDAKIVVTRQQLRDREWTTANRELLKDPSKYQLEPHQAVAAAS